ncbi:hypothetical protein FA15DRAFT_671879, partial [Coprinopsis marcescibilis]
GLALLLSSPRWLEHELLPHAYAELHTHCCYDRITSTAPDIARHVPPCCLGYIYNYRESVPGLLNTNSMLASSEVEHGGEDAKGGLIGMRRVLEVGIR